MQTNAKKGFTLIELIVVISIITIVGIMAVPNYYSASKKARYEASVTDIVGIFRDARNTSITGKFTKSGSDLTTLAGGYGVYLDQANKTIISFQDKNENQIYNTTSPADTIISTYNLPPEINIKTMTGSEATNYTGTLGPITTATILFKPPQGETFINENDSTKELIDLSVQLERYDEKKSKTLKINKISGFIETE